jgi:PAS domain S-box-containing protein
MIPLESSISLIRDRSGNPTGFRGIVRDISERKHTEEALRESQQIMRLVLDTIPVGVFWKDKDSKYLGCNRQFAIYSGLGSSEEIIGKDDWDMPWAEDSELYIKNDCKVIESGTPIYNFEHLERKSDGNTAWLSTSKVPLYDAEGRINGLLGTYDDITVRKLAEEAIRKSEERYRTIFESTATANIITAEDTTILLANTNFANLVGYSKQELEGKISWTVFVENEDLERLKNYHMMRRINPGSAPSSYEFRFINRKGEVRDLFMNVALIPETKDSVASMIDITEWKRSKQARSESEERFRELAELLPEIVYEADRNGVFTFVNKTGFEKFGYVQEDLSSKMSVFDVIIPGDHQRLTTTYQKLIKGERIGLGEYTARKRDGSTFPALVYATAIFREGKPVGHRGFVIDISEKKNLENQLTRAQKMEAIGTLAGGIAHDFNNLLMGILGNISLILLQFDQTHPIYDRLKSMEGYVQRGSDLTKQLLGFARGGKYEVKPINLGEFIRESSDLFGRTKKEIRIHHKAQKGLWTVEVDRGQIEQVLLNLYMNAWQAMPNGGDLYLSAENVELDNVDVSPYEINPGRFIKVTITDTGTGMDEATKARIFEPFFTTKERGRGTGLGLASAYGIVKNHGGFIHVESEKDIGSSFMIYLPVSDKDVDYDKKPVDELLKGREKVLLIDDEEMILDVSAKMLEELGYQVISAAGGRMGLHAYEQNKDSVDLIILDMIMPEIGGRELFDTMIQINPSVKVLLSSGYSLDSQAKEIMQRGCKGFIQKPFTMTDLSKKIREILDIQ